MNQTLEKLFKSLNEKANESPANRRWLIEELEGMLEYIADDDFDPEEEVQYLSDEMESEGSLDMGEEEAEHPPFKKPRLVPARTMSSLPLD